MLRLADARYLRQDGYPSLEVVVEGRLLSLEPPCKPTLHDAGLVYLGEGFGPSTLEVDGREQVLEGVVADRRLWELVDRFGRDCNSDDFAPGPVPIPD